MCNTSPLTSASDHGVSESLISNDPDGNGVELYWDKPTDTWPGRADGSIEMFTKPLISPVSKLNFDTCVVGPLFREIMSLFHFVNF
jgi:catechol-2,3-dioxygenase